MKHSYFFLTTYGQTEKTKLISDNRRVGKTNKRHSIVKCDMHKGKLD